MATNDRMMHLGFTIWPTGFHPAAWRLPESIVDGNSNARFLQDAARTAERGKFDFFFIGDRVVGLPEWQYDAPNQVLRPEALALTSNLAAVTEKLGLVATINTTYADPYTVARATATIDHLSGGRLGWNVVTGINPEAAGNFNRTEHWDNSRRYDWATEFIQVVQLLWDSWEDGARRTDKASGLFVDEERVHRIDYRGDFFSVDGPLNVERPVQGQIPIVNAGASERSRDLGARYADIRFTNSSTYGLTGAQEYYKDLKGRLAAYGRSEDEQFIIPGLAVYVAADARDAHAKYRQIQELTVGQVDLAKLSAAIELDLTGVAPEALVSEAADLSSLTEAGERLIVGARGQYGTEDVTVADLWRSFKRAGLFKEVVGSPVQVADVMEEWFESRAADGFMIFPPHVPGGLDSFVDLVVPELQRRELFRTEYTGSTFREHFGLSRPENIFAARRQAAV